MIERKFSAEKFTEPLMLEITQKKKNNIVFVWRSDVLLCGIKRNSGKNNKVNNKILKSDYTIISIVYL